MVAGAFLISEKDNHIRAQLDPRRESIPNDQAELLDEVFEVQSILEVIFKRQPEKYNSVFPRLLSLAQVGLVGDKPETSLARQNLTQLKAEIMVREGTKIKLKYLARLGALAAGMAAVGLVFYLFIWQNYSCGGKDSQAAICSGANYGLLWTGAMIGVWLSVAASRGRLTFEDLPTVIGRYLEPTIRLVFAGLLAIVLGLFLAADLLGLVFGGTDFSKFDASTLTAILLGIVAGIGEKALAVKIISRSDEVAGAAGASSKKP